MRRPRRIRFVIANRVWLVCAALLVCSVARPAAARQLVIQNFDDQVAVHADGTTDVTERIAVQFIGHWNGIYRTIPVGYRTDEGLNYTLLLDLKSITDDTGQNLRYKESRSGRNLRLQIWVPDAEDNTRTLVIRYRVLNAIRFSPSGDPDQDEFYWNVTGTDWEMPIEAAAARIDLPDTASGVRAVAYTGAYGSRAEDANVAVNGNVVSVRTTRPLGFHEGLTVVVGMDKGAVQPPSAGEKIGLFLRSNWPFIFPIAIFCVMFWLWWTRGRDPQHGAVVVQYDPPDQLTPGECGTLVDNEAAIRDITATLVDLAVKGYLSIKQSGENAMLGLVHAHYSFHMEKPAAEWPSLRPHEQQMMAALFDNGAGEDVSLSDLQNHFYVHLPEIRDRIFDALMEDGYYLHRPDTVRGAYLGIGLLVGFLEVFFSGTLSVWTGVASFTWILAAIASGAVIAIYGRFMPARTRKGWQALEKVIGFEQFLTRVEKDQITRLEKSPDLFQKYLPYAMALHVEKKWAQAFSGIAMQPPQWYQGAYPGVFQPLFLMSALSMMNAQAASTFVSSPRSVGGGSGISGFGGGGMSGGGFGGGGGGGF